MPSKRLGLLVFLLSLFAAWQFPRQVSAGDEWQPITQEDLKMTSDPNAPGAPAIILYRQVDRNDSARTGNEYNYVRVKILTEEGRKQADVEIPYVRGNETLHGIRARTIRPDGSIAEFDGKVFDKTIVKAKGFKISAKTFTLPDVQVGSIIEYHYMSDLGEGYVYDSRWILSDELYTRYAKFSLKPNNDFALRWAWPHGLPAGTEPPKEDPAHVIRMEVKAVPAFQVEDLAPPQDELKFRVDFVYSEPGSETDPDKFWKKEGKKRNDRVESFVGKKKAMEQALSQIVAPNDSPEVKLQKIYARVQQFRNLSFEHEKTEQENKRDKLKDISNVEDLWKRGYGYGNQMNYLFIGLARAAGLEAYSVVLSDRSHFFFNPKMMSVNQLDGNVVLVKLNGKDLYFDPATAFTPYALLPWEETNVTGLRLDKDGGSWVTTALPPSSESRIERKADLKLTETGDLEGKLTVTFSGLEALTRRLEEREEDDTNRKKYLEDTVKEYVPAGIDVELTNKPDWNSSAPTLVAEYSLKVPGWVAGAGRRALCPVGLFGASEKHLFEHANRVYPVYFEYPSEKVDDISIQLPLSWQAGTLPNPSIQDAKAVVYTSKVENKNGLLHLNRDLKCELVLLETKYYPTLRNFYQIVRTGDEQQIILQPGAAAASK